MKREDLWLEGWPRAISYDKRDNDTKNATRFLDNRPVRIICSDGVFYNLEEGIWRQLSRDALLAEIQDTNTMLDLGSNHIKGVADAIAIMRHIDARPFQWIGDKPPGAPDPRDMIFFGNGILDFQSGKLWAYDGSFFATSHPDYAYDPKAECPLWEEKLHEWLDKSSIQSLQEFFGYAMTADNTLHVILALLGAARGGKSTIYSVLERLCGKNATASVLLHDLAGDFGLQGMEDKRIIVIPDASDTESSKRSVALNRLKAITGNDSININRKHMPAILDAQLPARVVLIANKHPKFLDESGALALRELPINFTKSWDMDNPARDPALGKKLMKELPGIANWALRGLKRLRANGNRFTKGKRVLDATQDLKLAQSPALRFAGDHLIVTGGKDFVSTDTMYERYCEWAWREERLSGKETRNRTDFKNDLLAALMSKKVRYGRERHGDNGDRKHGWWGVRLIKLWDSDGTEGTADF